MFICLYIYIHNAAEVLDYEWVTKRRESFHLQGVGLG